MAPGRVTDAACNSVSPASSARARIRIHAPHLRLRVGGKNRVEHQQARKRKPALQFMHLPGSENHFRFLLRSKTGARERRRTTDPSLKTPPHLNAVNFHQAEKRLASA